MSSIKCPNCGLVNFADASDCKRCQSPLSGAQFAAPGQPAIAARESIRGSRPVSQTAPVQPSFVGIVKNDYGALMGALVPVICWAAFIVTNVFGVSLGKRGKALPPEAFLYIALGGTLISVGLLVWRVRAFQQVFASGEQVVGHVTSVSFFKDRGRIEYSFSLNGHTYQSGNAIMKNRTTEAFRDGDQIELVVDRSNPNRAFIKALYS